MSTPVHIKIKNPRPLLFHPEQSPQLDPFSPQSVMVKRGRFTIYRIRPDTRLKNGVDRCKSVSSFAARGHTQTTCSLDRSRRNPLPHNFRESISDGNKRVRSARTELTADFRTRYLAAAGHRTCTAFVFAPRAYMVCRPSRHKTATQTACRSTPGVPSNRTSCSAKATRHIDQASRSSTRPDDRDCV